MSLLRTFETGLRGIAAHWLRSILTTLGIHFGVAAVISTVGIGQASSDSVNSRIASLGTNELTITGGTEHRGCQRRSRQRRDADHGRRHRPRQPGQCP